MEGNSKWREQLQKNCETQNLCGHGGRTISWSQKSVKYETEHNVPVLSGGKQARWWTLCERLVVVAFWGDEVDLNPYDLRQPDVWFHHSQRLYLTRSGLTGYQFHTDLTLLIKTFVPRENAENQASNRLTQVKRKIKHLHKCFSVLFYM